jgi:exopolyphosphatase/guanosine-5'-triphosphate,3'-diphosphate pyrophosphatase
VTERYAAVDIGTNSVRLLVTDAAGASRPGRLVPVERLMRITRLGQGVDATRRLGDDAIDRTLTVLREYHAVMDELGVTRVRATATSAARDATNRDAFFDAARDALGGVGLELLPGEEEARLSFLGATSGLADPPPYLVVDIGGGSTEFIVGTERPDALVSVDMGCVRLTEQFVHSDPPSAGELSELVSTVRDHLADVARDVPGVRDARTVVGLAGTVTTIAAIEMGLPTYDAEKIHHFRLSRSAAEDVFRTLATETLEQRRHNPGLEPGRVDVIVAGAAILVTIMRTFDVAELVVSEADILDGLVRSLAVTPL